MDAFLDATTSALIAFNNTPFAAKPADRTPDFDPEEYLKHLKRRAKAAEAAKLDAAALLRGRNHKHQLVLTLAWLLTSHRRGPDRDAYRHALNDQELSKFIVEILKTTTPIKQLDLKALFGDKYAAILDAEEAIKETNTLSAERVAADWIAHGHPRPLDLAWESSDPRQPTVTRFFSGIAATCGRRLLDKATPSTLRKVGKMTPHQRKAGRW